MRPTEEFEAAGLYDPAVDTDRGRLDFLRWLEGLGFTIDDMVVAHRADTLLPLANDRRMVPGERLGRADTVALADIDPDEFDTFARALGFTPIIGAPPGEIGVTATEARALAAFGALGEIFSHDEAIAFLRVVGSAVGRVGEAAVSLFLTDIESRMLLSGQSDLEVARTGYDAVGLIDEMGDLFELILRRHMLQASERNRRATIGGLERFQYRYAIGFIDLVGFTEVSGAMNPRDLAVFIRDFEGRAHDIVTAVDARVVKLIGDEVMFVATDPDAACRAGSALMEGFGGELERVVPRGGLAFGDVLVRGGDYYGPVVNLAARVVDEAVPRELLVTEALAHATRDCRFEPAGRRMVKGFAEPVTVQSLASC